MKSRKCILFEGGMRGMGITFHLSHLACELHRLCPDLKLIVVHDGTEQERGLLHLLNENGIESFNYALNNIGILLVELAENGYSIIFHAESYGGCRLIEPYKKRFHIHVLLGMNAYKHGSPYRELAIKFIRFRYGKIVDTYVFFSQQAREEFCRSANVYNKTFVIPWGVEDLSELKCAERYQEYYTQKEDFYQPDVKYVFYAAQFHKHKKHRMLVNLLESYLRDGNVKLVLAGNGAEMDNIHQLCIDKEISNNVIFLGRVPRKEFLSHLKNAFCSLVLSKNETFGHCILEPLQLGIPVISTPRGIAPSIITDFNNGLTIPLSNKEKWAKAIDGLLNGHLKLEARHQELYTWPMVANLYVKLYNFIASTY